MAERQVTVDIAAENKRFPTTTTGRPILPEALLKLDFGRQLAAAIGKFSPVGDEEVSDVEYPDTPSN